MLRLRHWSQANGGYNADLVDTELIIVNEVDRLFYTKSE